DSLSLCTPLPVYRRTPTPNLSTFLFVRWRECPWPELERDDRSGINHECGGAGGFFAAWRDRIDGSHAEHARESRLGVGGNHFLICFIVARLVVIASVGGFRPQIGRAHV